MRHVVRLAAFAAAGVCAFSYPVMADEALVERGAYLARIMDCGGCHTNGMLLGAPDPAMHLAGSDVGFSAPFGTFYPPNLTPDVATGLGSWSAEDIETALRTGVRPDGRELVPMMPWQSYSVLAEDDMAALIAYLQSLPPVTHDVPDPVGPGQPLPSPALAVVMP